MGDGLQVVIQGQVVRVGSAGFMAAEQLPILATVAQRAQQASEQAHTLRKAKVSVSLQSASSAKMDTAQIVLIDGQLTHLPTLFAVARSFRNNTNVTFGYVPFSPSGAQLLFQFCAALHERVSVLITTNLPFGDWVQVLGDERLTSGLLDRLTFRCHILEFLGDSFRFRHGLQRQASVDAAHEPAMPPVG